MNSENNSKRTIIFLLLLIFLVGILISTVFVTTCINHKKQNEKKIESVIQIYSNDSVQEKLTNDENNISNDLLLQIDGEKVVGVIKISKINFEGLVYDGTSLDTLAKGVGHFNNSPYFDGNVCLAAHNSNKFWAKLHTMQVGDEITYVSFLGTRKYKVSSMEEISETDWSKLSATNSNILTLITCVANKPNYRLCLQAVEIK